MRNGNNVDTVKIVVNLLKWFSFSNFKKFWKSIDWVFLKGTVELNWKCLRFVSDRTDLLIDGWISFVLIGRVANQNFMLIVNARNVPYYFTPCLFTTSIFVDICHIWICFKRLVFVYLMLCIHLIPHFLMVFLLFLTIRFLYSSRTIRKQAKKASLNKNSSHGILKWSVGLDKS